MKKHKDNAKPRKRGGVLIPALVTLLLAALILGGITLHDVISSQKTYGVTFYQMTSDRVSRNIRFLLLTDLHLREYGEDNAALLADVAALGPDVILLGGDLVTYGVEGYGDMLSLCGKLARIAPSFMVMGNHEDEKTFLDGDEELAQRFADTGVSVLRNRTQTLAVGEDEVEIVGISGNAYGFEQYGGRRCMDALADDYAGLRVVMAHIPTLFPDALESYAFDLGVAGHTHGGIIRLPRFGGLYTKEEGLLPTYDGGKFALQNGATLVVSRGLGNSGVIPRVFNRPELVVIDVNWY